jgi:hypothetical protein
MVVVSHHIGSPRHTMINQKDRMTHVRLRMSEGFSTGGCLRVVDTASGGLEVGMVLVGVVDIEESTSGVGPLAGGRRAAMLMMPFVLSFSDWQRTRSGVGDLASAMAASCRPPGTVWRVRARGDRDPAD